MRRVEFVQWIEGVRRRIWVGRVVRGRRRRPLWSAAERELFAREMGARP